jgi:hypothetical protein
MPIASPGVFHFFAIGVIIEKWALMMRRDSTNRRYAV